MEYNIDEIMHKGYDCLVKELGYIGMERFIAEVNSHRFDYVTWRQDFFAKMEPGQFLDEALDYAKAHPHQGKGQRI